MKKELMADFHAAIEGSGDGARMVGILLEPDHEKRTTKIKLISLCPAEENEKFERMAARLYILCGLYLFFRRLFGGKAKEIMGKEESGPVDAMDGNGLDGQAEKTEGKT